MPMNTASYHLITDSTSDLPGSLIEQLDIRVLPLTFTLEGVSYLDLPDGGEMSPRDFYNSLREGKRSITSQINEVEFVERFEPYLQSGQDILYLAFSSALSGTCYQAQQAAEQLEKRYPQRKILVLDTLAASLGEGLLVYEAAKLRLSGKSLAETADFVMNNRLRLCHWFTVDDLNHLKRGGRVSATAALLGTMLGIKPILHVDDEGRLIPVSKVRGRGKSLEALVDHMEKTAENPAEQTVFISHGDCPEDAKRLEQMVKERFDVKEVVTGNIGPVIGSHSGPGTLALFFFGSKR